MKRAFLAIVCGAALMASSVVHAADAVSDKEMADRYSQAAQSGDSDAQFYLAALYSSGTGRPRSDEEAFRWFSRAADQGHSHAMLVLSGLYAVGRGVQKDNSNAYKWAYIVSVGSRVDEFRNGSRQLMGVLESRMTREEVDRAKAEAGRWHAVSNPSKPVGQARPAAPATTAAAPADSLSRDSSGPATQPSLASSRQSPANPPSSSPDSGTLPGPRNSGEKKNNDIDALLDRVPSGLRKRFGF
jgi:Sel1 repeat-containing protein